MSAFDGQISSEVSLARVLDEMIVDGTDFDVVSKFLESHEDDLDYIFKNSAFVFELFDIATHPNLRIDEEMVKKIEYLDKPSMLYALCGLGICNSLDGRIKDEVKVMKMRHRDELLGLGLLRGWSEYEKDMMVANGEDDFVEMLNRVASDIPSASRFLFFLTGSTFTKSAFMMKTFLRLDVTAKISILSALKKNHAYYQLAYSLIRQCLVVGDIPTVNSILRVLASGGDYDTKTNLRVCARRHIPTNLICYDSGELKPFEEVVFDIPFHRDEFETLDLFMYGYFNDRFIDKIIEFPELVDEQFNLSFDWRSLLQIPWNNFK